jgi:uncharacterized membrane protein
MSPVHVHLLLNHVPVVGIGFAFLVLLIGVLRNSDELKKVAFGLFVLAALITVPVYLSGEPSEDAVEHLPGVAKSVIESHEESALIAFIATGLLGLVSLVGIALLGRARAIPKWFGAIALVLALVTGGLMARTGNLGGQVRHTEIRNDAAAASQGTDSEDHKGAGGGEEKERDRD